MQWHYKVKAEYDGMLLIHTSQNNYDIIECPYATYWDEYKIFRYCLIEELLGDSSLWTIASKQPPDYTEVVVHYLDGTCGIIFTPIEAFDYEWNKDDNIFRYIVLNDLKEIM